MSYQQNVFWFDKEVANYTCINNVKKMLMDEKLQPKVKNTLLWRHEQKHTM